MEQIMSKRLAGRVATVALAALFATGFTAAASAAPRHRAKAGVHYAHNGLRAGTRALVSDGPGTGYGFHRLPGSYRVGAFGYRQRQADAVHEAVDTDAITSGGFRSGFLGDDTPASQPYSSYGVFSGADGYGSPFFAGYYGRGDGEDLGPFGHTYADD